MREQIPYEGEKPKNKSKRLSDPSLPVIYNESLMEIFDFNESALLTNQRGFVTEPQKRQIADTLKGEADSMWLMLTIMLGTAVLLAIIFTLQGYPPLPLVIGVGLILAPLLWLAYRRQNKLQQDSNRLRTYNVEGYPSLTGSYVGDSQAEIVIGEQKLPISYAQAKALSEFNLPLMRIYYASHSKQILSAEVLHDINLDKLKNEDLQEDEDYLLLAERQLDEENSRMQQ